MICDMYNLKLQLWLDWIINGWFSCWTICFFLLLWSLIRAGYPRVWLRLQQQALLKCANVGMAHLNWRKNHNIWYYHSQNQPNFSPNHQSWIRVKNSFDWKTYVDVCKKCRCLEDIFSSYIIIHQSIPLLY